MQDANNGTYEPTAPTRHRQVHEIFPNLVRQKRIFLLNHFSGRIHIKIQAQRHQLDAVAL